MDTQHWVDRASRRQAIEERCGKGNLIAVFYWDKGHRDGAEYHYCYDNGIIEIHNAITDRLVTMLIARPGQLTRYTDMGMTNELNDQTKRNKNWRFPQRVLNIAYVHQRSGMNHL